MINRNPYKLLHDAEHHTLHHWCYRRYVRHNTIILFMCVELMLNAVNLLLVAFSTLHNDSSGQVFVFFIMAVVADRGGCGTCHIKYDLQEHKSIDTHLLGNLKN